MVDLRMATLGKSKYGVNFKTMPESRTGESMTGNAIRNRRICLFSGDFGHNHTYRLRNGFGFPFRNAASSFYRCDWGNERSLGVFKARCTAPALTCQPVLELIGGAS
jgi:hypothetical protein